MVFKLAEIETNDIYRTHPAAHPPLYVRKSLSKCRTFNSLVDDSPPREISEIRVAISWDSINVLAIKFKFKFKFNVASYIPITTLAHNLFTSFFFMFWTTNIQLLNIQMLSIPYAGKKIDVR